jgi:hypothetical protein
VPQEESTPAEATPQGRLQAHQKPAQYVLVDDALLDLERAKNAATKEPHDLRVAKKLVLSVEKWLSQIVTEQNIQRCFSQGFQEDPLFNLATSDRLLRDAMSYIKALSSRIQIQPPNRPMSGPIWVDLVLRIRIARAHLLVLNKEYVSFELAEAMEMPDAHTKLTDLTPAERHVLTWLRTHQLKIAEAERLFNVDRRAIAGAIAWEALVNFATTSIRGVGPGKVHVYEDITKLDPFTAAVQIEGLGPPYPGEKTLAQRIEVLRTPEGAITYIAAIMSITVDIAGRFGRNVPNLRCDPALLAGVYNWLSPIEWVIHVAKKPPGERQPLRLTPELPMGVWVGEHLVYLEDCVGKSQCSKSAGQSTMYFSSASWEAFYKKWHERLVQEAKSAGVSERFLAK